MPITNYLEEKLSNHAFRNVTYAPPATVYLGLSTSAGSKAGGFTEPVGAGYARVAITYAAWTSLVGLKNNADVNMPAATGSWGTIVAGVIFDSLTGGNAMAFGALTTPRPVNTGDVFTLKANDHSIDFIG